MKGGYVQASWRNQESHPTAGLLNHSLRACLVEVIDRLLVRDGNRVRLPDVSQELECVRHPHVEGAYQEAKRSIVV